jgi:hypothetical protein
MTRASNDLLDSTLEPSTEVRSGSARFTERIPRGVVNLLTILGFGLPVLGYFLMLRSYSVNIVIGDQWDDVVVIGHSYSHLFDWSSLWAQHNENRILFPNLIVLLLAHTTSFNIQVEEYLSFVMLTGATALFLWSHKRRSNGVPWLYYCPVAILMFSVVQYENTLWGFQMAWYLVLLCLAATLVLLDGAEETRLCFAIAIIIAVIGSYSSLQGLLIWPAGLIILWLRGRSRWSVGIWVLAAVLTTALYFYNFNPNTATPDHNYIWQHPLTAITFFLFTVGNIVGVHIAFQGPINLAVVLFGLVIVLVAALAFIVGFRSRVPGDGRPIGMVLIVVGLAFAGIVTAGRVSLGYWVASGSRYTTFDLLTIVGIYLTLLSRTSRQARARSGNLRRFDRTGPTIVRWCLVPIIIIQMALGLYNGLDLAASNHRLQLHAVEVLRTIDHQSNGTVSYYLYLFEPADFIRREARVLKEHHLSVFAGDKAS